MPQSPEIAIIAAIGTNRELGLGNELLWRIPEDLKRFKSLSIGHPVIMGRKTSASIGKPLPHRTNIVITRDKNWAQEGVVVCHSFEEALAYAKTQDTERVVVAGGAEVYEEALPHATVLYLTRIDDTKPADVFFPPYEHLFANTRASERHTTVGGLTYVWVDLTRTL